MANNYGGGVRINRTGAATWVVTLNGVSQGSFTSRRLAESTAAGLRSNAACAERLGNLKAATAEIQLITLTSYAGTDSFTVAEGRNQTVAFVRGTNGTEAAITTGVAALTGDAGAVVTGTDDEGPFTVTYAETTRQPLLEQGVVSGCTAAITVDTTGGVGL